jgi:predicted transcriptional regulator
MGFASTATTRSDYAYWLFATYPDLKQNEIARRVGLTPSTVNAAMKKREGELRAQEEWQNRQARFGEWSEEAQAESRCKETRDKGTGARHPILRAPRPPSL